MKVDYVSDKGDAPMNEDSLLITSHLFGIFDGATGLIKYTDAAGNTGGLLASRIAKNIFEKNKNIPLLTSIEETTKELHQKMKNAHIKDSEAVWTASVSVIRINEKYVEYIQLGDSPIVFIYKDGTIKTLAIDHDLETLRLWKKLVQEGVRDVRSDKRMEEQLLKTRRESNSTHGVLNGMSEALQFVTQGSEPKETIETILIFSDGMLIPQENPEEPKDYQKIIQLFKSGGLEEVKQYVRKIENTDPHCLQYPRFKQHDDLTAIAISFP